MNLTGKRSPDAFWTHDVADAAALEAVAPSPNYTDWGSGAGIPGLLWAAISGGTIRSVEATSRKCAFQREFARTLSLEQSQYAIVNARIEEDTPTKVIPVTARAVASLKTLLTWADAVGSSLPFAIFFKGENAEEEIEEAGTDFQFDHIIHPHPFRERSHLVRITNLERRSGDGGTDSRETRVSVR